MFIREIEKIVHCISDGDNETCIGITEDRDNSCEFTISNVKHRKTYLNVNCHIYSDVMMCFSSYEKVITMIKPQI